MKGKIDNNLNIEEMIRVDFSDVKKQLDKLLVENKNQKQLLSFIEYCTNHPEQRFYQCLRNWSGEKFILFSNVPPRAKQTDTFYIK